MAEMHDKDDLIQRTSLMCYESFNNCYWQQFTFIPIIQKVNLIVQFLHFRKVFYRINFAIECRCITFSHSTFANVRILLHKF